MMTQRSRKSPRRRQTGAALFVSLALLVALSILGIAAARSGLLQNLMSANTTQTTMEIEAATSAVGAFFQRGNDPATGLPFLITVAANKTIVTQDIETEMTDYATRTWSRSVDQYGAMQVASPAVRMDNEVGRKSVLVTGLEVTYYPGQEKLPKDKLCPRAGSESKVGEGSGVTIECQLFRVSGVAKVDGAGDGRRVVSLVTYYGSKL